MRLFSYHYGETARIGAAIGDWGVDLNRTYRELSRARLPHRARQLANCWIPGDMTEFLEGGDAAMNAAREAFKFASSRIGEPAGEAALRQNGCLYNLSALKLLPVVPHPGKVICVGKNYAEHAREMGGETPAHPELFVRFPATLIGPGDPILKPRATDMWDYEAELAVIIGRGGRRIERSRALEHVAGYACFNDCSARDFQKRTSQWTAGKNFENSGPLGPWLTTPDEVGDPQNLDIRLTIDGETMQSANTRDMVYPVDDLIARISEFTTLTPGDVIATGTPAGVGAGRTPPRFLQAGESVTVSIEKVGQLTNPVAAEGL